MPIGMQQKTKESPALENQINLINLILCITADYQGEIQVVLRKQLLRGGS